MNTCWRWSACEDNRVYRTIRRTSLLRNCPSSPVLTVTGSSTGSWCDGKKSWIPRVSLAFFLRSSNMNPHCRFFFFFTRVTASLGIFGRFSSAWIAILPRSTKLHIFPFPNTPLSYSSTTRLYEICFYVAIFYFNFGVAVRRTVTLFEPWYAKKKKKKKIYIYIYIYIPNTKETRYTRFVQERTFQYYWRLLVKAVMNLNP